MKALYKYAAIIAAAAMLSSCEDFLDSENLTQKTTANFPETEQDADEMLTSIYANLLFEDPEKSSQIFVAQLAGDECLGGNLSSSGNCAVNFLLYKDNLNGYEDLWNRCYRLINRANNTLATLGNVKDWSSAAEEQRHYGEAHFLRALAYYELVQMFGGVPLRDTNEAINIPRNTVDEVYALIASDLAAAIEELPAKIYPAGNAMAGHATRAAAQAYMARVFLFYTGRYGKDELPGGITKQQVINWIDDCVYNSGHDLVPDQRTLWSYTNDATRTNDLGRSYAYADKYDLHWVGNSSIETVFALKHNLKSNWTYTWFSNTFCQFYSPSADNYSNVDSYPFGAGWGAGPVSPAFIKEWQDWAAQQQYIAGATTDPRISGSVWSYKAMDPNEDGNVLLDARLDDSEPLYTVSYRYFEQTGYHQKKYININACEGSAIKPFSVVMYPGVTTQTSASLTNISDYILMRFADVLLMQSELKGDAEGLNRVRARSGLAPVAYSLEALKNERKYELAFEGTRYYDILRWSGPSLAEAGQLLNRQTGFNVINAAAIMPMPNYDYATRLQKTQGYWQIPQNEIDKSNGVLEQNEGWDVSGAFTDWTNM